MANGDLNAVTLALKSDNRTVVGTRLRGSPNTVVTTSAGPVTPSTAISNVTGTALTPEAATKPAYISVAHADTQVGINDRTVVIPIMKNLVAPDYDKRNCRTQYFFSGSVQSGPGIVYNPLLPGYGGKRCYVNANMQPLDANGLPTTVASAINAESVALTAVGQAVTNYEQVYRTSDATRAPVPGKYMAHPYQTSLYAPYVGWTCQQA